MASRDPGTDAARQEVLRARDELSTELERLEAATRAALDIRAKVRRHPGRTAAAAGVASFLVLGGPGRVWRAVRRLVRGAPPAYPPSLLPSEIEKIVRSLGEDGDKVRGVLERGFAAYLGEHKEASRPFWREILVGGLARPVGGRLARLAARRLLEPDPERYLDWLERIRARRAGEVEAGGGRPEATSEQPARPMGSPGPEEPTR
ncbi:MAG: hypothetical protein ACOYXS_03740 [Chloroflexota bacterium]